MKNHLLVLGFACVLASEALATGLYVCNESGEDIKVAHGRYENSMWAAAGWTPVKNQICANLVSSFSATRYYVYALGASGKVWGGSHAFCTSPNDNFFFANGIDFSNCESRGFFSVWVPDMVTGSYPAHHAVLIGPNNVSLDHPRAER